MFSFSFAFLPIHSTTFSTVIHSSTCCIIYCLVCSALLLFYLRLGTEHRTNRAEWVVPVTRIVRPSANTAIFVRESGKWPSITKTDLNTVVSFAQDNNADDRRIRRYHLSQASRMWFAVRGTVNQPTNQLTPTLFYTLHILYSTLLAFPCQVQSN